MGARGGENGHAVIDDARAHGPYTADGGCPEAEGTERAAHPGIEHARDDGRLPLHGRQPPHLGQHGRHTEQRPQPEGGGAETEDRKVRPPVAHEQRIQAEAGRPAQGPKIAGGKAQGRQASHIAAADQDHDASGHPQHAQQTARSDGLAIEQARADQDDDGGRGRDQGHVQALRALPGLVEKGVHQGHAQQGHEHHEAPVAAQGGPVLAQMPPGKGQDGDEGRGPAPEVALPRRDHVRHGARHHEIPRPDDHGQQGQHVA